MQAVCVPDSHDPLDVADDVTELVPDDAPEVPDVPDVPEEGVEQSIFRLTAAQQLMKTYSFGPAPGDTFTTAPGGTKFRLAS